MRPLLAPILCSLAAIAVSGGPVRADLQLVMFEQPGCGYCMAWDRDVATEYPLTAEGRVAPLRRLQIAQALPADLRLDRPAAFTPTFVLVNDGAEVGRIEGYPGEDFFWGLLAALVEDAETRKIVD